MRVLFLDIDGVLNDHTQHENKYCGTKPVLVSRFNRLLASIPDLKIVVSSAWRYMILRGDVTLFGFEMLLNTHGLMVHNRLIGHTEADGAIEDEPHHHDPSAWKLAGLKWRRQQIYKWAHLNSVEQFVVVDDLPLDMPELVQTDGEVGITDADVQEIIRRMKHHAD